MVNRLSRICVHFIFAAKSKFYFFFECYTLPCASYLTGSREVTRTARTCTPEQKIMPPPLPPAKLKRNVKKQNRMVLITSLSYVFRILDTWGHLQNLTSSPGNIVKESWETQLNSYGILGTLTPILSLYFFIYQMEENRGSQTCLCISVP